MDILKKIDHTLLAPTATLEQIHALCDEARQYGFASVCIPPRFVRAAAERLEGSGVPVCTVIGFPLGYNTTITKLTEADEAVFGGATELDMVINIGALLSGDLDAVREEIAAIRSVALNNVVKVIIETCLLDEAAKIAACRAVTEAKADFIKTSTGFSTGGATIEDIQLLRRHVGPEVRVKASGGIRTAEQAEALVRAGADRLGMSSAVKAFGLKA